MTKWLLALLVCVALVAGDIERPPPPPPPPPEVVEPFEPAPAPKVFDPQGQCGFFGDYCKEHWVIDT